jgi:N6-adenosine-specific RNA methylase IME4
MDDLPQKDYQLIYADPPWEYKRPLTPYPTMTNDELAALTVPAAAAKDSVLCLWATFPRMIDALDLMKAWGFTYKTQLFTWVKVTGSGAPRHGMGHYTRSNAEVVLIGVRGKGLKRRRKNIGSVIMSRVREHSRKPDEVRDLLVDLFGNNTRRLEMFARTRYSGWDAFGNQVTRFGHDTRGIQKRMTDYTVKKD